MVIKIEDPEEDVWVTIDLKYGISSDIPLSIGGGRWGGGKNYQNKKQPKQYPRPIDQHLIKKQSNFHKKIIKPPSFKRLRRNHENVFDNKGEV